MSDKLSILSTKELLLEYSKGKGMPGSGCISVLSAMSGVSLLISVCKLTLEKEKYTAVHDDIKKMMEEMEEEYLPKLQQLYNSDEALVKEMLSIRLQRDYEENKEKKKQYEDAAMYKLRIATESVADICGTCLDIIPTALFIYDHGLISARGDSAVAISNLLSTISGNLYMILFNIYASKKSEWIYDMRSEVETYFGRLQEYQFIYNGRMASLYNKAW